MKHEQAIHESSLNEKLMDSFSCFINQKMGLFFPKESWKNLSRKLVRIAADLGFNNAESCLEWLATAPNLTQQQFSILTNHLTIGETYFFRDFCHLELLKNKILPELIIQKQKQLNHSLRIWSAGCCTGEEPYSIAILLHMLIPAINQWNITLLGTDINPNFLDQAKIGCYKNWSFRSTPEEIKHTYFIKNKKGYSIIPEIKQMLKFKQLNLIEDHYSSLANMDLILCNNVLMYFSPERIKQVVKQLAASLVEGGYFLTSPIEAFYIQELNLILIKRERFMYFKKVSPLVSQLSESDPENAFKKLKRPLENLKSPLSTYKKFYEELDSLYKQGQYEQVAKKIERHFEKPEDIESSLQLLLINSYVNLRRIDLAHLWCQKLLKSDKLNPELYYMNALLLKELNQIPAAIQSLKQTLYLNSNFVMANFLLGSLLLDRGNRAEANRCFRNTLQLLEYYAPQDKLPGGENMSAQHLKNLIHQIRP